MVNDHSPMSQVPVVHPGSKQPVIRGLGRALALIAQTLQLQKVLQKWSLSRSWSEYRTGV